ncbi:MAG: sugar transferase [Sporolactobacillus sp.]
MALSKSQADVDAFLVVGGGELLLRKRVSRHSLYFASKRLFDAFGALCGLILLSPVLVAVAIAVKIENPRAAIIFKQKRIGKKGKIFFIYKFRSMVPDAEHLLDDLLDKNETTGAMFKMHNDPRIMRIGHFIRRTSIDELPQLYNVLRGEMSLVGPRPPLPREVAKYSEHDKLRLLVTPGCTGLWQVSGRSDLGFAEMVRLDIQYIYDQSLLFDFKIVIKTIAMLIHSKGAY